jgi:hypothetical protein
MKSHPMLHKLIAGSLLATFTVIAVAPAAEAGHGWGQRRKFRSFEPASCAQGGGYATRRVVEYRHVSRGDGGSTLAGFLGGLAIGAIITSAAQSHSQPVCEQPAYAPPPPDYCPPAREVYGGYGYEDPYCHERYASLELYLRHTSRGCNHPRIVRVIDNRDGDCVDVIRYSDGQWSQCDPRDYEDQNWDD